MFNTLKYTKQLEEVGFTRQQAETHMEIMMEITDSNLATKQDAKDLRQEMKDLRGELKQEMQDLRSELKQEIKDLAVHGAMVKAELENKIMQSEYRLTIKLGTIVSVAIGVAVALVKLI